MEIIDLYNILSMDEKIKIANLLKEEKLNDITLIPISDWLIKYSPSVRLCNTLIRLKRLYGIKFMSDVKREDFFNIRGSGLKTWNEFTDLINKN
mgnify:CR=1 FL=1|jgi:hypothetical protein